MGDALAKAEGLPVQMIDGIFYTSVKGRPATGRGPAVGMLRDSNLGVRRRPHKRPKDGLFGVGR